MGKRTRLLEILPNFLLFFLFACCMFFVLLSGAKLYRNVSGIMEEQFSVNTCVNYVTAKVRHYDMENAVSVGKVGECDALLLDEDIRGVKYTTYLYCDEGNLMEMFCVSDMEFLPSDGQVIMPLDELTFTFNEGILSFSCESEGETAGASVFVQSGRSVTE